LLKLQNWFDVLSPKLYSSNFRYHPFRFLPTCSPAHTKFDTHFLLSFSHTHTLLHTHTLSPSLSLSLLSVSPFCLSHTNTIFISFLLTLYHNHTLITLSFSFFSYFSRRHKPTPTPTLFLTISPFLSPIFFFNYAIFLSILLLYQSGVNFINIKHTNFSYKR